jgi:hypothetical protein
MGTKEGAGITGAVNCKVLTLKDFSASVVACCALVRLERYGAVFTGFKLGVSIKGRDKLAVSANSFFDVHLRPSVRVVYQREQGGCVYRCVRNAGKQTVHLCHLLLYREGRSLECPKFKRWHDGACTSGILNVPTL